MTSKSSANGQRMCPRCGDMVEAELLKEGYEVRELKSGYGSTLVPDSLTYFKDIAYNCPTDGKFIDRETGKRINRSSQGLWC